MCRAVDTPNSSPACPHNIIPARALPVKADMAKGGGVKMVCALSGSTVTDGYQWAGRLR
jgi:hypothetical protein